MYLQIRVWDPYLQMKTSGAAREGDEGWKCNQGLKTTRLELLVGVHSWNGIMTNCHYMRTSLVGTSSRGCVYFSCFFFLYLITFRLRELPQQQKASNITHQGEAAHTSTVNDIHNFDYHEDGRVFFIYYLLNLLLLGYVQQRVDATGCLAMTMTTTP